VAELDKWLTKEGLIFSVGQVTALLMEMDVDGMALSCHRGVVPAVQPS
jgi:hypothetical protein